MISQRDIDVVKHTLASQPKSHQRARHDQRYDTNLPSPSLKEANHKSEKLDHDLHSTRFRVVNSEEHCLIGDGQAVAHDFADYLVCLFKYSSRIVWSCFQIAASAG